MPHSKATIADNKRDTIYCLLRRSCRLIYSRWFNTRCHSGRRRFNKFIQQGEILPSVAYNQRTGEQRPDKGSAFLHGTGQTQNSHYWSYRQTRGPHNREYQPAYRICPYGNRGIFLYRLWGVHTMQRHDNTQLP